MASAPRFGAIVLAAGRSSRFTDGHKLLADVEGKPLIRHALDAVVGSCIDPIVLVVSSATHDAVMNAAGPGPWTAVINGAAQSGMASSLQSGAAMMPTDLAAVLIVLGDMPGVKTHLIDRILAKAAEYPEAIIYPVAPGGQQGHPVLWPSDIVREFGDLTGDQGGKPLLRRHAHRIVTIPADNSAVVDIDTIEDLAAYTKR